MRKPWAAAVRHWWRELQRVVGRCPCWAWQPRRNTDSTHEIWILIVPHLFHFSFNNVRNVCLILSFARSLFTYPGQEHVKALQARLAAREQAHCPWAMQPVPTHWNIYSMFVSFCVCPRWTIQTGYCLSFKIRVLCGVVFYHPADSRVQGWSCKI